MSIKEQLAAIVAIMNEQESNVNKAQLVAKVMQLVADLNEKDVEISEDVFESLNPDTRKAALLGFLLVTIETLGE
jgi:hypothetical protein